MGAGPCRCLVLRFRKANILLDCSTPLISTLCAIGGDEGHLAAPGNGVDANRPNGERAGGALKSGNGAPSAGVSVKGDVATEEAPGHAAEEEESAVANRAGAVHSVAAAAVSQPPPPRGGAAADGGAGGASAAPPQLLDLTPFLPVRRCSHWAASRCGELPEIDGRCPTGHTRPSPGTPRLPALTLADRKSSVLGFAVHTSSYIRALERF